MGLGSFCELLVAGQQRAGGGFPRLCWAERGRPGGASGGKQVCLATLGSQDRLLEHRSQGVWGCHLLIGKLSEEVAYSDSFG